MKGTLQESSQILISIGYQLIGFGHSFEYSKYKDIYINIFEGLNNESIFTDIGYIYIYHSKIILQHRIETDTDTD